MKSNGFEKLQNTKEKKTNKLPKKFTKIKK